MTEIEDGDIVIVGPLVQTQIILHRVFQLEEKENQMKSQVEINTHII